MQQSITMNGENAPDQIMEYKEKSIITFITINMVYSYLRDPPYGYNYKTYNDYYSNYKQPYQNSYYSKQYANGYYARQRSQQQYYRPYYQQQQTQTYPQRYSYSQPYYYQQQQTQQYQHPYYNYYSTATYAPATEATTAPSSSSNDGPMKTYYENMGWKTDDSGNVFVGDDNAKLLFVSEHIATQHLDYIQWKCALCGLKKYKQEQVEEHQRTVHKRKTGVIIYTFDDTKKFGLQTLMKAAACRDRNDEIAHVVENGQDAEMSPVVRAFSSPIIEQTPSTESGPSTSGQMNAKVKTEAPEPEDNNSSANFEQQGSSNGNYEGDLFRPVGTTVKMESEEVEPSSSKQTTSRHAPKRDVVSMPTTQVARTHVQPKYSQLGKQQNLKVFQPAVTPELKDDRVKCMKCSYHVGIRHMKLHVMNHLFMEENICCFSCGFPGCIYKAYSKNIVTAHINKFHGNRGDYSVIESVTPHIEQKIQALFKECFDNAEKIVLREEKLTGKNLNATRSEDGRIYCKKCDQPISSANLKVHAFSHLCENEPDIECFKCSFPGCDYKHFVKQPVSAHIQRYHSENYQVQGTTSPELDRKIEKILKECFDIVINSEGEASSSNSAAEPPTKKIKTEGPQPENEGEEEGENPEATGDSEKKTIECRVCYKSISNSGPEDYSIIRHLGVHMHKIYNMPRYSCQICSYQVGIFIYLKNIIQIHIIFAI
ncbi:hypothetical protein WR25_24290 [Diploscapter pachys]|uniref:C2H2-type domain-containing protein n=1 Tax=Diploscapter pachys TaxID=2018661 RepID=A0A2A2J7Z0_9BILA|nr:hypothetical protein WR25_24290 [Diploscapter pachys]